jgi:hypothetical protein
MNFFISLTSSDAALALQSVANLQVRSADSLKL